MQKDLKNILYVVDSSDSLIDDEKNTVLKSVKAVDKELSILKFKLERTERVKKTTAILLEETIEELEQKRKAVEIQNRELEIEAALERIRARAMGMQSSEELEHVANILREQMGLIGQPGLDTIAFHLYDENSEIFETWYAIRVGEEGEIKTGKATFHKEASQLVREILSGYYSSESSYTLEASGNKMMEFFNVLVKAVPEIEKFYKEEKNIKLPEKAYYHLTDFSGGSLVSVSYYPPSEETKNLQKRVASVFDMAYRRYLDLKRLELQNSIIQADNDRKTRELEEARQLQLAMLPKKLPQLPHLEITVHMKTATEVGGDYYDFSTKEDGSLNICLGDATGHGMKAGILVSAMKSIFITNSPKMTIEEFFITANNGFKSMNLKRMMMGLTMLNINDHSCKMINAGMPPVFFYSNKLRSVQQIEEHGIPIGAMKHIQFNALNRKLEKGDVIILMTDGMPELQNETGEMYGYERTQNYIEQIAGNKSKEIIEHLKTLSKNWANENDQEDDITFVVIKVKE